MSAALLSFLNLSIPLLALLVLLSGSLCQATAMWVVDNVSEDVFIVNVDTLTAARIGSSGLTSGVDLNFGGLGFAKDGTLYAMSSRSGGAELYTVDQSSGSFQLVGVTPLVGMNTSDIDPVTNEATAWSQTLEELHDVNLATGEALFRASTTLRASNSAFSPEGTLFYY